MSQDLVPHAGGEDGMTADRAAGARDSQSRSDKRRDGGWLYGKCAKGREQRAERWLAKGAGGRGRGEGIEGSVVIEHSPEVVVRGEETGTETRRFRHGESQCFSQRERERWRECERERLQSAAVSISPGLGSGANHGARYKDPHARV